MKTFGQLLHVEDVQRDGAHYRIAVFRVEGGVAAKWSCDKCPAADEGAGLPHPSVEACVMAAKHAINAHQRERHAG